MKLRILLICILATFGLNANADELAKEDTLKVGDKSPEFRALDKNGKEVKIADFKGKYIYIDVWATWCEPCKKQIPFMKELEKKFQGKNIVFVSISSEANRGKWGETLRVMSMTGIQLSTGGDRSFMDAYRITGIPRFILLDKEGRILNLNMTRPSDPQTEKTLEKLKDI